MKTSFHFTFIFNITKSVKTKRQEEIANKNDDLIENMQKSSNVNKITLITMIISIAGILLGTFILGQVLLHSEVRLLNVSEKLIASISSINVIFTSDYALLIITELILSLVIMLTSVLGIIPIYKKMRNV